jgi:two-component system response regulator HydG
MEPPENKRYRILIADDSEVCCGLLAMVLRNADYEVLCVYDGLQAVEAVRSIYFDLIILDHEMPRLNGLGALEVIRSLNPRLPVMVCSGKVNEEVLAQYNALGIDTLFTKPLNPLSLKEEVSKLVEHYRQFAVAEPTTKTDEESHTPFLAPGIDARILEKPIFSGVSIVARKLVDGFMRMRRFKAAATLEGRPGAGFLDFAVAMAESKEALLLACPAKEVSERNLIILFAPALLQNRPIILIITNSERLTNAQQAVLNGLYTGEGALDPYFLNKVSLILCAEESLHELADAGSFDEQLLMRTGAMSQRLPELRARNEDLFLLVRAILRRVGASKLSLTHAARVWLENQSWPGDYIQLHRTIEIACKVADPSDIIDKSHLISAKAMEAQYKEALFQDMLLESLYEFNYEESA